MRRRFPLAAVSVSQTKTIRTLLSSFSTSSTQSKSRCLRRDRSECQEPDMAKNFLNSLMEDDDFSELGPPVKKNGFSSLKLLTEKYGHRKGNKPGPSKDMSPTKHTSEEGIKSFLSVLWEPPKNHDTNPVEPAAASRTKKNTREPPKSHDTNPVEPAAAPRTKKNTRDRSHIKGQGVHQDGMGNSNSVTVENVATSVNISPEGGGPQNATIKIHGLTHDMGLSMVHSFLKSAGCLEEMAIKQWGDVEAVYRVKADSDLKDVLKKLNGAIINKSRISAQLIKSKDSAAATPQSQGNRNNMGLEVSSHLKELHNQFNLHTLYAEDLYNLHLAIMHLESQSGTSIHD